MASDPGHPLAQMISLEPRLLDLVAAAVIVSDLSGTVIFANAFCESLYGIRPEDLVGERATRLSPEPLAAEQMREISDAVLSGGTWEGDFRVEHADGSLVEVHAIDSPLYDHNKNVIGVVSVSFDVTAERQAAAHLRNMINVGQILRDIGQTLVGNLQPDLVWQTVLDAARRLTRARGGVVLAPHDGGLMTITTSGRMLEASNEHSLGSDDPLVALLTKLDDHAAIGDVECEQPDAVATVNKVLPLRGDRVRSLLAAPVRSGDGDLFGYMCLAHFNANAFDASHAQVLTSIASQAGQVLDIARLLRAAETELEARRRSEAEQRFYAETSALLSWSLAYPESFEQLARLCVPFLADLCLIDVTDDQAIRRVAAVHADPEKEPLVRELGGQYSPDPYGAHPAASVARGGISQFAPAMSDEFLRQTTRDDDHFRIVKQLGFTSYMCVPLIARGRTLGALTLVSAGSGRRFDADDLARAEEFARRAALALDNARLYSERDHVARALQSSLLPPSLPAIPGVRIAARYRAAGEGNEVGGDFYDVFQLQRRSWVLAIGDVSGKGPEAAAIAGLARHTLRAVALEGRTPRRLLTALHEALVRGGESHGQFCTVCCALLQPREHGARLTVACGGHPPPLVRKANGETSAIDCTGGMLGLSRTVTLRQRVLDLDPGDIVVLYTDGITEAHERNAELFGEERLMDVVSRTRSGAEAVADAIVRAVTDHGPAEPRDDLAVLVLEVDPQPTEH